MSVPVGLNLNVGRVKGKANKEATVEIVSEAVAYMVDAVALSMEIAADSMVIDLKDRPYSRNEVAAMFRQMATVTRQGWLDA